MKLMSAADKVLIVTRQSRSAVSAANALAANVDGIGGEKYVFVCNDFDSIAENALITAGAVGFTVNEYVGHFANYDRLRPADFAADGGIQRAAYLMM